MAADLESNLDKTLKTQFRSDQRVFEAENFQVCINKSRNYSLQLYCDKIKAATVYYLQAEDGIRYAVDQDEIVTASIPSPLKEMMINGYNQQRSGKVVMATLPGWLPNHCKKGCTHSVWNPYDTHIPLIFMGWKINHGTTNRTTNMTDISATLAALLHIQMPSGCIGTPILEVLNKK